MKFGASGVSFYFKFKGTGLEVTLQDEFRDSTSYNWFMVSVDGREPTRFRTRPGQTRYTLAHSLEDSTHHLVLMKDTEGQNGHNILQEVYTDELLQFDPLPEYKIEYIGDSITAGFGVDEHPIACDEGTWFDHTTAWHSYASVMARKLNAQWMLS
ncbi:MAG: hypothetical protein SVT56_11925, partial [Chloroflexota bacterium]|nr:hypothetical protein [Chloroflexota bacterium]